MSKTIHGDIMERAAALNFPMFLAGGQAFTGEASWRRFAHTNGYAPQLLASLDASEAAANSAADFESREADRSARRDEARRVDPEIARDFASQARADSEQHERLRPARIEELLGRCADALERLAKR